MEADITMDDIMREISEVAIFPREYMDLKLKYIYEMIITFAWQQTQWSEGGL